MVKVAILGFGVVGSGVAEVLSGNGAGIQKKADELIEVKYILDVRDFPDSPFAQHFVKDFSVIENDPEVNVVVETIGGVGAALDFTERALKQGKSVVTSNKELVATHGRRLLDLAAQNNAVYLFEASVGGGIPILRPLSECMSANEILEICGILNGTANYIFTRMVKDHVPFAEALAGAQANGYAEQDPSADVEGKDTCRKLCILSSIAYGWHLLPDQVPTTGITKITLADEAYAAAAGRSLKLLGRSIAREDGTICAYVEPHFVGNQDPAARQMDRAGYRPWQPNRPDAVFSPDELSSQWYVRLASGELAGEKLTVPNAEAGESGWITAAMTRPELDKLLAGRDVLAVIRVLD